MLKIIKTKRYFFVSAVLSVYTFLICYPCVAADVDFLGFLGVEKKDLYLSQSIRETLRNTSKIGNNESNIEGSTQPAMDDPRTQSADLICVSETVATILAATSSALLIILIISFLMFLKQRNENHRLLKVSCISSRPLSANA